MLRPYISSVFRRGDPARQVRLGIKKRCMQRPRQDIKLDSDFSSQRLCCCPVVQSILSKSCISPENFLNLEAHTLGDQRKEVYDQTIHTQ
jgi:hypothetical protein